MNEEIKLRDKRTDKLIEGSLEEERTVLKFEGVEFSPNKGINLEIDLCGPPASHWDGSETVTDAHGDRVFVDVDGDQVPERFVEPFVEGMAPQRYHEVKATVRLLGPDKDDLVASLDHAFDELDKLMRGQSGCELYVEGPPHGDKYLYREPNATEMALALRGGWEALGIDKYGRPLTGKEAGPDAGAYDPSRFDERGERPSHWDVKPGHPLEDWKYEVQNDEIRLGYHEWVEQREQGARDDGKVICLHCGNAFTKEEGCDSAFCTTRRHDASLEVCRTCGVEYSPYGDGYDGECPECADKTEANRLAEEEPDT